MQEEVAFALELLIDPARDSLDRPVVVTGAMKPHDVLGYDGHANLRDALAVCLDPRCRGLVLHQLARVGVSAVS
jgi:L-asparaginase/Glu-tRNA(Gln) amidotransferase subunit D